PLSRTFMNIAVEKQPKCIAILNVEIPSTDVAAKRAVTNLRTNFLLQEIAQAEKITVSDADLLGHISQIAQQRKQPIKKVIKDLQKNRQIQSIRNSMLIGQTIDFLVEQANVTEVSAEEFEANPA
ncbi:MAG: hypothetical protein ACK5VX_11220, partial [Akkermansiaceae bacterium]